MVAYTYRMPAGIAGAISRPQDLTTEPAILSNAAPFIFSEEDSDGVSESYTTYGVPGKYDDNGYFVPLASGDSADAVVGFLVRPYPTTSVQDFNHQVHTGARIEGDILKRGYLNVQLDEDASDITRGAAVTFDIDTQKVGTDGSLTIANAYFSGPGDAAGNVEIAYNI